MCELFDTQMVEDGMTAMELDDPLHLSQAVKLHMAGLWMKRRRLRN